ncbi:hypothetical protein [uncultured Adlercreutzia sp.]|uniref:hypothetical protein n=1 Tax=uncultured Adlercreutzia sp. TaxID=875803 RepID=UPI00259020E0|nr:hypothetical protein [uncultured Adlercreutzia sp.]
MDLSPYATAAEVHSVEGRVGCGKTQRLVEAVLNLLAQGVPPREIILFAATPAAACALERRLKAVVPLEDLPLVTTLPLYALDVLSSPQAEARTGRRGRILMGFEERLLLEDVKTSGVAPRRLSEMLKFFYRSWADLEPMSGDWFYDEQEERVFRLLVGSLRHRESYLACELPRAAFDYGQRFAHDLEAFRRDYVLFDDYQMASRASQCLAGLLARTALLVASEPCARTHGSEDYPHFSGIEELVAANPNAVRETLAYSHLSRVVTDAVNLLAADETLDARPMPCACTDQGGCEAMAFERPESELKGVVSLVSHHLSCGARPQDIAVAAATRQWAMHIAQALQAEGIAASPLSRPSLGGDMRHTDTCRAARAFTLLRLAADPEDPLALRSWCGFGDYLAQSALANAVASGDAALSLRAGVAFADAPESALLRQQAASATTALAEAAEIVDRLSGLRGSALIDAAIVAVSADDDQGAALLRAVAKDAGEQATASALCDAVQDRVLSPGFVGDGVRVGQPEDFAGQTARVVIMAGLVNGLVLPRRYFDPAQMERDKRPAMLAAEMAKTYACAGKAASTLLFTYFTEAPLAEAESLQLKIHRVRLREGERVCEVHPSETIRSITGVSYHD